MASWDPARDRSATVSQPGPSPRPSVKFEISALQTTDDDAIPRDTRTGTLVAVNVDVAAGRNDDSKDDFYAPYSPRARPLRALIDRCGLSADRANLDPGTPGLSGRALKPAYLDERPRGKSRNGRNDVSDAHDDLEIISRGSWTAAAEMWLHSMAEGQLQVKTSDSQEGALIATPRQFVTQHNAVQGTHGVDEPVKP